MATKISLDELSGMYKRYCGAVTRAGYDTTTYRLQLGDTANSYRSTNGHGGGTIGTGSYGYLGDTRREAYRALLVMAQALEDVRYFINREDYKGEAN